MKNKRERKQYALINLDGGEVSIWNSLKRAKEAIAFFTRGQDDGSYVRDRARYTKEYIRIYELGKRHI